MSTKASVDIAILYDPDGYTEPGKDARRTHGSAGLMGRQVAGREFLDAYLSYGQWDDLTAVVRKRAAADPLVDFCKTHWSSSHQKRRLHIVDYAGFLEEFDSDDPPARLLYTPFPADQRLAWARQSMGHHSFAMCGVTHTLCSKNAIDALCSLVSAPFESHDALICTSKAVSEMVDVVLTDYCDYLRDRFGGDPKPKVRLEMIPLGVNTDRFRPPSSSERNKARHELGVADDEVMALFVGRLSHHAKAHPFPMFHAANEAVRRTGKKLHLVMAGWTHHPDVEKRFRETAQAVAPNVRLSIVDGQSSGIRDSVWKAADVFVSLPDNIQETFGLVIVEAMASGLPVVGSDWNGYRDLIADGETGFRIPTFMARGAASGLTARLMAGAVNYDHFLAECCQTVTVDAHAAADALTRLVVDSKLRQHMGSAGRDRAVNCFSWERVVASYETLWREQHRDVSSLQPVVRDRPVAFPYPEIDRTFEGYPTAWLTDDTRLLVAEGFNGPLKALLSMPLTNHESHRRCDELDALQRVLADCNAVTVGELKERLSDAGIDSAKALVTIAWLLKYAILRVDGSLQ